MQFNAIGNYSDGSTQNLTSSVSWSSSDTSVATISNLGLATISSYKVGPFTITATSGTISGSGNAMALINLPKTGQTTCYQVDGWGTVIPCVGTGQDGELQKGNAWPGPRIVPDLTGDCMMDILTGLMWVRTTDGIKRTWYEALDYANNLTLCGYDDWHLPNKNELRSLINYNERFPTVWLSAQGFYPYPPSSNDYYDRTSYWTSTTIVPNPNYRNQLAAWAIDMYSSGEVGGKSKTDPNLSLYGNYAWPVRSISIREWPWGWAAELPKTGQTKCYDLYNAVIPCAGTGQDGELQKGVAWPSPRFLNSRSEGGIIVDRLTGLVWLNYAPTLIPATMTWRNAFTNINTYNYNYPNSPYIWRLPNVNELESLINAEHSTPSAWLNTQGFTNVSAGIYWTSTSHANLTGSAWAIDMFDGHTFSLSTGNTITAGVLLVSGPIK
jgi:hypothetical protein